MYDYFLGGHDNFAADRIAALKVIDAVPEVRMIARENRKFLGRAVRFLADQAGIEQFLDLGTGLPTRGNVHQVAQQVNRSASVIYVDNDPMVLATPKPSRPAHTPQSFRPTCETRTRSSPMPTPAA